MSKLDRGILLDTHTWIWLCQGSKELSKATIAMIDKLEAKERYLFRQFLFGNYQC